MPRILVIGGGPGGYTAAFAAAVEQASALAQDGWVVTFGIEPEAPDTGFGYIVVA